MHMFTPYDLYLVLLLVVKLTFIGAAIKTRRAPTETSELVKENAHRLFNFLMGCLLIYVFKPGGSPTVTVDRETKVFLFTFGILTLIGLYNELF
jgi:hypothetical protein